MPLSKQNLAHLCPDTLMDTTWRSRKSNTTPGLHSGATRPAVEHGVQQAGTYRGSHARAEAEPSPGMAGIQLQWLRSKRPARQPHGGCRPQAGKALRLLPPALAAST